MTSIYSIATSETKKKGEISKQYALSSLTYPTQEIPPKLKHMQSSAHAALGHVRESVQFLIITLTHDVTVLFAISVLEGAGPACSSGGVVVHSPDDGGT